MAKEVFISYKSDEFDDANWVRSILENNGISCWMAPSCIPGGSNYAQEIPKAIKGCKVFVLILSQKSQESKWVPKEIDQAINEGKIIMPFMIENCSLKDDFNFYLSNIQRYYAYENKVAAIRTMIEEICAVLGKPAPCAEEKEAPVAPAAQEEAVSEETVIPEMPQEEEKPAGNNPIPENPVEKKTEKQAKTKTKKPSGKKKIIIPLAVAAGVIMIAVISFFASIFSSPDMITIAGKEIYGDTSWLTLEDAQLSVADVETIRDMELTSVDFTNCSIPDTFYSLLNNEKIHSISLKNCNVTDDNIKLIDFSVLENLSALDLSGNKDITTVEFISTVNTYLARLDISGTSVTDLTPLAELENLTNLNLADMELEDISPISGMSKLSHLDVSGNNLKNLDAVSALIYLEVFSAANNPLESTDGISNCTILTHLDLSSTGISDISVIEKSAATLKQLYLDNNEISFITSISKLTSLTELSLDNNKIYSIDPLKEISTLSKLSLKSNQIINLSAISKNTNLSNLDVSFNNISGTLDLSFLSYDDYTSLTLDISNNTYINGLVLPAISVEYADIRNTSISDLSTIADADIGTIYLTYNSQSNYRNIEPSISTSFNISDCPLDKRVALEELFSYKINYAEAENASEAA